MISTEDQLGFLVSGYQRRISQ